MVKKDAVVSLNYVLKNDDGQELDKSSADQPFAYLHGNNQIVPGLENALEGLAVGDQKEVTVSPSEGYGEHVPGLQMAVDRSNFPEDMELQEGMQFSAEVGGNNRVFTITGLEADKVQVDGNHPLAGQTLHFAVEVVGVRDATQEELEHGHVHGEGGHQH
ncbi:MAG: peptidylprolyl isomerase [Nitrospinaceae bacterium]|nr:peptidylprolyl isomerase [Nitrospinaceae bacterium]NIR53989.1 peptidylprolyl isomerase [Nitrospinaceae bacterium]NIS84408.1 peptidylprolyl isomerase [Nitrospinaceae bacterium]NIT81199.1 peptidylprolyl isomerase [Nitrospinaceae bacterium]NIU43488.1 peptidylprolyl isomerase [Nitrospinaceae bacterium]